MDKSKVEPFYRPTVYVYRKHGVSFYNPQLEGWSTHYIPQEAAVKDCCRLLLYVISEDTRAMTSMIEVATTPHYYATAIETKAVRIRLKGLGYSTSFPLHFPHFFSIHLVFLSLMVVEVCTFFLLPSFLSSPSLFPFFLPSLFPFLEIGQLNTARDFRKHFKLFLIVA